MKNLIISLAGLGLSLAAPLASAQEQQAQTPAAAPAGQDSVAEAVHTYFALEMYRTYMASAEMLDDASYDDDVVAGAQKLLEIAETMPTDGLPESYKAYLQEKNARQRKSIGQIRAIMNGRSEEEMTPKDLAALRKVMAEAEADTLAISRKYPEAEAAMGEAASQAFTAGLAAELGLEEKAKQFLLEHPEVAAGGPEAALAASMRETANEIRKYLETKGIKVTE